MIVDGIEVSIAPSPERAGYMELVLMDEFKVVSTILARNDNERAIEGAVSLHRRLSAAVTRRN